MAGIGAVFVLWLAVLIAPYAEGGLPGILLNMNEITAHPFRLELCADTGKAVGIFLGGYALVLLYIFSSQKNFRHGEEHGSAKWENVYLLNHRLHDKEHPDENRILSRHLSITTDQRKLDKNLFTLVIGGSGSRKTRAYVKPNLLQCNSSYIIMDPKGELLRDIGNVFKAEGYKIRVFDLIDMLSSFRYNPFVYFKRESDIQGFITNLFANTEDKTKHGGDAFWDKTAKMMLSALMYYVWYECPETEMNFGTVMELILAETVEEGDEAGISATQVLIEELRARSPRHIAVRYFDAYRKGAGETIMSIQESLLSRLEKFLLEDVVNLTTGDELELEKIGEEKTALFIRMPDDNSFHFLASALITQLFQLMMAQADARSTGSLPVPVHFVLEEARNITLPDSFQNWVATMRSRNITLSIILQNISQIKRMFPDDWESVSGMCDEILYLGGNEQSTHEWISKAMGQETIDNRSYGTTHSWTSGSNSTNEQNSGRALMDVTEVRLKNKLLKGKIGSVIMILADERPIIDEKYDLNRHPRIKLSADGGAPQYSYVSSALLAELPVVDRPSGVREGLGSGPPFGRTENHDALHQRFCRKRTQYRSTKQTLMKTRWTVCLPLTFKMSN